MAEDPLSFKEIYHHKYFQPFSYYISQDHKLTHHKLSNVQTYWNIQCSPQILTLLIMFEWHSRSGGMLRLFLPLSSHTPISDGIPICVPVSSTMSPSFPLSRFSSSSLADVVPLSSLSRILTHYAYLLIFLSPISCTILRPIVAGPSQAFLVFNPS